MIQKYPLCVKQKQLCVLTLCDDGYFVQIWQEYRKILILRRWTPFSLHGLLTQSACTIAHNIAPYDSSARKSPEEPQQQLQSRQHPCLQAATSLERQSVQEESRDGRQTRGETHEERSRTSYLIIVSIIFYSWCWCRRDLFPSVKEVTAHTHTHTHTNTHKHTHAHGWYTKVSVCQEVLIQKPFTYQFTSDSLSFYVG